MIRPYLIEATCFPDPPSPPETYDPLLVNLARRAMPNLFAADICSVQPMSVETGLAFTVRFAPKVPRWRRELNWWYMLLTHCIWGDHQFPCCTMFGPPTCSTCRKEATAPTCRGHA